MAVLLRRLRMLERIKRTELDDRFALRRLAHQVHRIDGIHLESEGAAGVAQYRITGRGMGQADRLAALAEQIDHRRAAEQDIVRAQGVEHARGIRVGADALQAQVQGQRPAAHGQQRRQRGQVDVEEVELFREAEVLGEQAVRHMRARRKIDQGVFFPEAGGLDRHGGQGNPASVVVGLQPGSSAAHEQRIAQGRAERRLAVDEHAQGGQHQLAGPDLLEGAGQAEVDAGSCAGGQAHRFRRADDGVEAGGAERQRRHGDRIHRAEGAGAAAHLARGQLGAARNRAHALRRAGVKVSDRAGRKGPQVVRIQHVEQGFGEFRVIVVEALGNASIEQGKRFDHALGMRVFAHFTADQQAPGDLRVALGEFAKVAAQVAQLAFVIRQ